jgi:hypothetical protein
MKGNKERWGNKNACKKTVGYSAAHKWIVKMRGEPSFCEHCKKSKTPKKTNKGTPYIRSYFQWANVSGKCKRVINDWKRLCIPCHKKFDNN